MGVSRLTPGQSSSTDGGSGSLSSRYQRPKYESTTNNGRSFLSVIVCGLILGIVRFAGTSAPLPVRYTPPPASYSRELSSTLYRAERTVPTRAPTPSPPPVPEPPKEERLWYRGEEIVRTRSATGVRYSHAAIGTTTTSLQEARIAINARRLRREAGIASPDVIAELIAADANGDGDLSWREIEVFQGRLYASYRYEANGTALRPEAFYAGGGGDCEDWSLVTCALLQFWGIDCAVGTLANPERTLFHAVALIRAPSPPSGYTYFDVGASPVAADGAVEPGFYVPIDYQRVGGVTNAAGPDWPLVEIHDPVTLYGTVM